MDCRSKVCITCHKLKPYSEFYRHPGTRDGHLGKCKECQKAAYQLRNPEKVKAYDKSRYQKPERKASLEQARVKRRMLHPEIRKARTAVYRAVRKGAIIKKSCAICGSLKSDAHHPDYNKPLEVQWLCRKHHALVEGGLVCLL